MGYYFEKARSREDLDPEQLERYKLLRSSDDSLPQKLYDRIEFIKEYVGSITSGEIWSAYEELVQDAFVTWILAGEDPQKVQWTHPHDLATPLPTEEEQEENRKRWEETVARWEQEEAQRAAEARRPLYERLRENREAWAKEGIVLRPFLAEILSRIFSIFRRRS